MCNQNKQIDLGYIYSVNNVTTTGSADSAVDEEQKKEKISELKKKEQEIQDVLTQKTKELKKICLLEAVKGPFFSWTITYIDFWRC